MPFMQNFIKEVKRGMKRMSVKPNKQSTSHFPLSKQDFKVHKIFKRKNKER